LFLKICEFTLNLLEFFFRRRQMLAAQHRFGSPTLNRQEQPSYQPNRRKIKMMANQNDEQERNQEIIPLEPVNQQSSPPLGPQEANFLPVTAPTVVGDETLFINVNLTFEQDPGAFAPEKGSEQPTIAENTNEKVPAEGIQNEEVTGNQKNQRNQEAGNPGTENQEQDKPQPEDPAAKISWTERVGFVGVGTAVGGAVVFGGFAIIGLSMVGPVAGGWFAANMGAGLVSGSAMSVLQSAAMTTSTYVYGGVVGTAVSSVIPEKTIANGRDAITNSIANATNKVANLFNP
jgi:hypothetical protein